MSYPFAKVDDFVVQETMNVSRWLLGQHLITQPWVVNFSIIVFLNLSFMVVILLFIFANFVEAKEVGICIEQGCFFLIWLNFGCPLVWFLWMFTTLKCVLVIWGARLNFSVSAWCLCLLFRTGSFIIFQFLRFGWLAMRASMLFKRYIAVVVSLSLFGLVFLISLLVMHLWHLYLLSVIEFIY